jgi:DNA-binding SARP family transcriptional activator
MPTQEGASTQYRALGSLEVQDGRGTVPVVGRKQRAILAVLLLHRNQPVAPDQLIDAVWDDRAASVGRNTLAMQLLRLRKVLHGNGDRVLLTHSNGYLLRVEPGALDLDRFERLLELGRRSLARGSAEAAAETLRRALALWRGSPFEDIAYKSFAQIEIERLGEQRLAALEERIEAELALGRHAQLMPELEALVKQQPLRERLRGQLMLSLYRSGRQADALATYRHSRLMLVEELGLEPGPALRQLEEAILRHDPVLQPVRADDRLARREQRPYVRKGHRAWLCSQGPSPPRAKARAHAI